jgi:hypothetical protein
MVLQAPETCFRTYGQLQSYHEYNLSQVVSLVPAMLIDWNRTPGDIYLLFSD